MTPVLILAGPTAVGKSELALRVAEAVGANILSVDSRQLLRGFDVGTAKPSPADLARCRHFGIDESPPDHQWTSGGYLEVVDYAITESRENARPLVATGGSTLYIDAVLRGLPDLSPVPEEIRQQVEADLASPGGTATLFAELQAADPSSASTLDPTKTHRLARWVGVLRATGRPPSEQWENRQPPVSNPSLVVLDRPRDELYARINARVDQMMRDGLLDEVRALLTQGPAVRRNLLATIGYRELVPVIEDQEALDDAMERIKRNTRRYAKRQLTWFRRYPEAVWLDARTATVDSVLQAAAPWPETA